MLPKNLKGTPLRRDQKVVMLRNRFNDLMQGKEAGLIPEDVADERLQRVVKERMALALGKGTEESFRKAMANYPLRKGKKNELD